MSATRIAKVVFAVMWMLFPSVPTRADSAPEAWSGIITLGWSSQLPENSPLRAQADRIIVDARTDWTMRVHFRKASTSGSRVEYLVKSATVDYLQTSHHDAQSRRGDASIHTLQTERLEASGRILDGKACSLVLWVDYAAKRYGIDVGGFELEDVPRSGQVLIEITDANGTRRVSDPASGNHDVIEPVRLEGHYKGGDPEILEGTYDANVEPPPGVDLSYQTIGGMVEWSLFRGACPDVEEACRKNAEIDLWMCAGIAQGAFELDCDLDRIGDDCFDLELVSPVDGQPIPSPLSPRDCVKNACFFVEDASVTDSALDAGVDAMMECWDEYQQRSSDCDDLCP